MAAGAEGRQYGRDYEVELDRRAAIRRALSLASPGDAVLLAGKGHERTMILAGCSEAWDERAEAGFASPDNPVCLAIHTQPFPALQAPARCRSSNPD